MVLMCGLTDGSARAEGDVGEEGRIGFRGFLRQPVPRVRGVMLAGNWKTARMVAHYSAGATAERGAVAKYL